MSLSRTELAALRRLTRIYRRILLLTVPVALAGCQDAADPLAPESADAAGEVAAPVAEAVASLTAAGTNRIVFASYAAPGSADIWTMSSTGGGMTRLTSFTGTEVRPVWSPDRKHIAFQRGRNGHFDIFLMDTDGTNQHWARPTASPYIIDAPSWSPDGTKLLVQLWISGKGYVARIDVATGDMAFLAPLGETSLEGRFPIYAKDGKWIYYVTGHEIHRFVPAGADVFVTEFNTYVGDLALSPDGNKLAFYLTLGGVNRDLHVLDLTSYQLKRLTTNSHSDTRPTWSPDGTKIAFASDRSGKMQIYTMNGSTGGNVVKITSKTYGADQPYWFR
jgi:Tol biopolymer transport system component